MGWWDGLSRVARPPGGYCAADSALRLGVAVCRGDRLASWRTKRNCRHRAGQGVVEVVESNRPGVWTAEGVTEEDFRVRAQGLESHPTRRSDRPGSPPQCCPLLREVCPSTPRLESGGPELRDP